MTAPTIEITRGGYTFAVIDDTETRSWNFWDQQYASGVWEPAVLDKIGEQLADGGDYVDLGAWVGPTVLWAAQFADHVVAVEPDPVAAGLLLGNVGMNVHNVTIWPAAATNGIDGSVALRSWRWGNSSSTVVPQGQLLPWLVRERPDAHELMEVDVPAVDVGDIFGQAGASEASVRLIKVDIEGGEEDLVGRLDEAHCPIILSLHLPWVADPARLVADCERLGKVTYLDNSTPDFPVLFIEP